MLHAPNQTANFEEEIKIAAGTRSVAPTQSGERKDISTNDGYSGFHDAGHVDAEFAGLVYYANPWLGQADVRTSDAGERYLVLPEHGAFQTLRPHASYELVVNATPQTSVTNPSDARLTVTPALLYRDVDLW